MSRCCARWFDGWMLGLGTCALAVHCECVCTLAVHCEHMYTGLCWVWAHVHWLGAHVDHLCSVQQVLRQMVGMRTLGREKRGEDAKARVFWTHVHSLYSFCSIRTKHFDT